MRLSLSPDPDGRERYSARPHSIFLRAGPSDETGPPAAKPVFAFAAQSSAGHAWHFDQVALSLIYNDERSPLLPARTSSPNPKVSVPLAGLCHTTSHRDVLDFASRSGQLQRQNSLCIQNCDRCGYRGGYAWRGQQAPDRIFRISALGSPSCPVPVDTVEQKGKLKRAGAERQPEGAGERCREPERRAPPQQDEGERRQNH